MKQVLVSLTQKLLFANSLLLPLITPLVFIGCSSTSRQSANSYELEICIGKIDASLKAEKFTTAYDLTLVAFRLAPSDPRLLNVVEKFAEAARSNRSDQALSLAEDLLDRGNLLVAYQPPAKVEEARNLLLKIQENYFGRDTSLDKVSLEQSDEFADVKRLLAVATNTSNKLQVRTKAAAQAKDILDDIEFEAAIAGDVQASRNSSKQGIELYAKIDAAEQECLQNLCDEILTRKLEWEKSVASVYEQVEEGTNEQAPETEAKLDAAITAGMNLLQDISPFAKANLSSAKDASETIAKKLEGLQRRKNWLYNKQCLALILEMESKKDWTTIERLRPLSEVKEEFLSPYILKRHNDLWDKLFAELHEKEKVDAVRLRILKSTQ